ncbi:MAG: V-type ATP synthase subunit I [Candidatus Woesearchaeota archaeon]
MNQSERMLKCKVVAAKKHLSNVINVFYELGLYHITPHVKGNYELDIGEPLADAEILSSLLVKIRSILSKFPDTKPGKQVELNKNTIKSIQTKTNKLYEEFLEIETELKDNVEKEEQLHNNLVALAIIKKVGVDVNTLSTSKRLTYFFGTITKAEGLEESLQKVSDECSVAKNSKYVFLVGKRTEEEKLRTVLNAFGFLPFGFNFDFKDLIKEINSKKVELKNVKDENQSLERKHLSLKSELPYLASLDYQLDEEIRKQELPLNFAVTGSTFVAEGWIPKDSQNKVEKGLNEVTEGKVHIIFNEPGKKEDPPIKLKHSKLVTPFEFLLTLYDLPKYKEFDPTSLLFFTFPLFFGIMLGDFGYGLVLFGVFAFLRRKFSGEGKKLIGALMFAALMSMVFGLVFGEVFGFESVGENLGESLCHNLGVCLEKVVHESHGITEVIYEFPRLLNRAHSHMNVFGYEVMTILVIGAIIGFFHLNLGYFIGFLNELKSHGFKHAFMAKISWMIIQVGIILAILPMMGLVGGSMTWVGLIVAISGIVFLGIGEGVQGIVELPAIFSNILSYMRLGAVGLASVGLAIVVNEELAMPFIHKGGIFIFIGMLIMLIGHTINILLGVLGPFLHGVRLHYVECFSKFFSGGGVEYNPFTKKDSNKNN